MSDDYKDLVNDLGNLIKSTTKDVTAQLEKIGMTPAGIDKFLAGEEIILCPYCNTQNMFEADFYEKNRKAWSVYQCLKCGKTLQKEWGEIPGKSELIILKIKLKIRKISERLKKLILCLKVRIQDKFKNCGDA